MIFERVILIVLDSVGAGSMPDAASYGDEGSHTLGHILQEVPSLNVPHLVSLGLGNIEGLGCFPQTEYPTGAVARLAEKSVGKDTTTGHWELAGVVLERPFPTFPDGFPGDWIALFEKEIGVPVLGNVVASGTEIISHLGDDHVHTGHPIVYTSADSVFQIAAHEDVIPLARLYEFCRIARAMLTGPLEVGRVIARPFTGASGSYTRTQGRKDFAIAPPDSLLDAVCAHGRGVLGIGKISDIFAGKGLTRSIPTHNNKDGIAQTLNALRHAEERLIFVNLVDFDMLYGHRRDVKGYAACLEEFDASLPSLLGAIRHGDLLVITADHGNDPTWYGTDHTREYVPVLHIGQGLRKGANAGTRDTFADLGATLGDALGIKFATQGLSYLSLITESSD